ncbi:cytochrome c [Syntrophotalea carbinolica DSM 2380]|uniref:Cytochrome c n=1 Tax=Syntrophotalea carbinolica (strain DSM 2380 / NBRC 103641 / GraBd1) TaxID=338963 RepID=Q3A435_SYNC1|nr:cytochrome c [Syntrophotalea carbinolica DSM 2380]
MNKLLIICALTTCLMACKQADWDNRDPVPTPYQASNIGQNGKDDIRFPHSRHASIFACNICHRDNIAKIRLDQQQGHGRCLDCHRNKGRGPTDCGGCHIHE